MTEGRLSIILFCPGAHSETGVEKHRDVIYIVSLPPLFYIMSASLISLPFGVPIPLSASPFLSVCLCFFPPFSVYLHIFLIAGYSALSCDFMFDVDDIRYECRGEHCNCYFLIIKLISLG